VTIQPTQPRLPERGYVEVPTQQVKPMPAGGPTPLWWVERLYAELQKRQPDIALAQRYVDGDHPTPMLDPRASDTFRRITGLSPTNMTGLVVGHTAARMAVQGFRFGDNPAADEDAWRIWQASDFDAESEMLVSAALTAGRSFVMVEPAASPDEPPRLYAEDATQMIVAYAAGSRRERLAALKVFVDEWTGDRFATLLLPGTVHKFRAPSRGDGLNATTPPEWQLRDTDVDLERNPLGEVPVFELRTRPRIDGTVRSEIADVIADQDACNHVALNTLIALEYGAFRQKWATGLEVPKDDQGRPIEPVNSAINRLLVADQPDARFGDFQATDIRPYIELYESRVRHMAAVTQTPISVLLGAAENVAADALALTISGHVNKVRNRAKHYEQAIESAMRCAFRAMGDPRAEATYAETIWMDPEIHSWAQIGDMAPKLISSGAVTPQTFQEKYLGFSETERRRDDAWRNQNSSLGQLAQVLGAQTIGADQQPAIQGSTVTGPDDATAA
jgi:hypothetical protein